MREVQTGYKDKEDFWEKLKENYEQIRPINSGGGGIIYVGIHKRLQKKVVLKKIRAEKLSVIGKEREMQILMNLKHTYLPGILDFWSYENEVYTVMEFIEGESFQELLNRGEKFKETEVIRWTKQLAEVLEYMHNSPEKIIHSDIKPANLMLTPQRNICLIDFNVSILQGKGDTAIGYSAGYSPMEQLVYIQNQGRTKLGNSDSLETELVFESETECRTELIADVAATEIAYNNNDAFTGVDERSDIYSACATMYHILTGKRPAACGEEQIPIEKWLPTVNDAFAHILMHGMEAEQGKRFQNASQMLHALQNLAKATKSYRRLLLKQDIFLVILLFLFLGSAGMTYMGWNMRVDEQISVDIKSVSELYQNGQYEAAVEYLDESILDNPRYQKSTQLSYAYYINGNCYLELKQYVDAIDSYRKAILLDSNQPEYYRDYGIALARNGNIEQAEECLLQAEIKGLDSDGIMLLQGEIFYLQQDYLSAEKYLMECLNNSKDAYTKLHACLKLDEVLKVKEGDNAYPARINLLENMRKEISETQKLLLLERLAQVYGDYGAHTKQGDYTEAAITVLEEIISMGYGTLAEWLNKAVYLQSLSRYEAARECLVEAGKIYTDNYLIYKRLAFLEIEKQSAMEVNMRDYTEFEKYYIECTRLYQENGKNKEQDIEMEYLYQIYNEVIVKGWMD